MISEYHIQKGFICWFKMKYPDKLINSDLGGVWTKNFAQAIKNKQLGHSNGFPDVQICCPAGKYHGLFIELKSENGRVSPEQKQWIERLRVNGYEAVICYGLQEAINAVENYFSNKP